MERQIMCFTCGKIINTKFSDFKFLVNQGISERDALTELGITKECCRMSTMGQTDVSEKIYAAGRPEVIENRTVMMDIGLYPEQTYKYAEKPSVERYIKAELESEISFESFEGFIYYDSKDILKEDVGENVSEEEPSENLPIGKDIQQFPDYKGLTDDGKLIKRSQSPSMKPPKKKDNSLITLIGEGSEPWYQLGWLVGESYSNSELYNFGRNQLLTLYIETKSDDKNDYLSAVQSFTNELHIQIPVNYETDGNKFWLNAELSVQDSAKIHLRYPTNTETDNMFVEITNKRYSSRLEIYLDDKNKNGGGDIILPALPSIFKNPLKLTKDVELDNNVKFVINITNYTILELDSINTNGTNIISGEDLYNAINLKMQSNITEEAFQESFKNKYLMQLPGYVYYLRLSQKNSGTNVTYKSLRFGFLNFDSFTYNKNKNIVSLNLEPIKGTHNAANDLLIRVVDGPLLDDQDKDYEDNNHRDTVFYNLSNLQYHKLNIINTILKNTVIIDVSSGPESGVNNIFFKSNEKSKYTSISIKSTRSMFLFTNERVKANNIQIRDVNKNHNENDLLDLKVESSWYDDNDLVLILINETTKETGIALRFTDQIELLLTTIIGNKELETIDTF